MSNDDKVTKVFLTGDRRMDPMTAALVTAGAIQKIVKKYNRIEVYTGALETGIERAVRYLVPNVNVIIHDDLADGKPDLDTRHKTARETVDVAVMIHGDPLASSIGKNLANYFEGDRLIFV